MMSPKKTTPRPLNDCGGVWCETCGDCSVCYGEDQCYGTDPPGEHFFLYDEPNPDADSDAPSSGQHPDSQN